MKKQVFSLISLLLITTINYSFKHSPTVNTYIKIKGEKEFVVDTKNSTFGWTGKKLTGEHSGFISVSSGKIIMNGDLIVGGKFEIDMKSITCTDLKDKKSNGDLVGHLKSDDFFAVDKFPVSTFEIISSEKSTGADASVLYLNVKGKLTIRGVTEEIIIPVSVARNNIEITCFANFNVDRTKFNVKYNSKKFFESIGDRLIYDDFVVDLKLNAKVK